MTKTIREYCEEIYPEIVEIRRDIHAHPETGMNVPRTNQKVCDELERMGVSYYRTGEVGVVAEIKGTLKDSQAIVMLRGDMDALDQMEGTDLPFKSVNEGKMHACGHDLHTAMLLGAVKVLNKIKDQFAGTVRFLFQPGEEVGLGARHMMQYNVMDGVDMGLGIHVDPLSPVGMLRAKSGPDWAAVDRFEIKVTGASAHGAMPHTGADAAVATCAIAMNLQTMVSRECDPMKPLVVTIGKVQSGSAFNIIAQDGYLEGTCRCFDDDVWAMIPEAMERVAKNTAEALKCKADVTVHRIIKPLINDESAYNMLKKSALKVLDRPEDLQPAHVETIGEDFAEFGKVAPCVFAHLGTDGGYPLHSRYVNFKEEAMLYGVATEVQFALDVLAEYSQIH